MESGRIFHRKMKFLTRSSIFIMLFRLVLGGLFIYASLDKIGSPGSFARDISNYHILPLGTENLLALILPWMELTVGIGLILGVFITGASILSMGMMGMFIIAIGSAILRGYNIECGCGLKEGEIVGVGKIIEDSIYFFLGWLIYKRGGNWFEILPKVRLTEVP